MTTKGRRTSLERFGIGSLCVIGGGGESRQRGPLGAYLPIQSYGAEPAAFNAGATEREVVIVWAGFRERSPYRQTGGQINERDSY